jgi:hypothetical protein
MRCTNATALKKFTSYAERHSSGVLSAIFFTGLSVPWLMIRPSIREKALMARSMTLGPICVSMLELGW